MSLHILNANECVQHLEDYEELGHLVDCTHLTVFLGIAADEWVGEAESLRR